MELNLGAERVGIALEDDFDCFATHNLVVLIVQAIHAVARVAVPPRCKALAVELETLGVAAVAELLDWQSWRSSLRSRYARG